MVYLLLSVIQSVFILVIFRLFTRFSIDNWQAITVNYLVAAAFGFLTYEGSYSFSQLSERPWFAGAILLGMLFIGTFFLYALSSQKAGIALTSVAANMSVVIPVIAGVILYKESLGWIKMAGIFTALVAFYLTFKKTGRLKIEWALIIFPAIMFLGTGINNSLMKYLEFNYISNDITLFLAIVFLTSLCIGIIVSLVKMGKERYRFKIKNITGGIILGLLNFGSTYYIIKAMGSYESSVVFPVSNSSIVGLSALSGYLGFKEPLSFINWLGIFLAIIAIFMIAYA